MYSFGKSSLKKLQGVHPDLVKVMMEAIKSSPVDFTIDQGLRTTAYQQSLYAQGRTKPGQIITKADGVKNKSNHQAKADGYSHAVDLYPYIDGKVDYNDKGNNLKVIAAHILATGKCMGVNIIWGGSWTIKKEGIVDKPHFQLK